MTKRRTIIKNLLRAGFVSVGGKTHENFVKTGYNKIQVPYHTEIKRNTAKQIYSDAGLEWKES